MADSEKAKGKSEMADGKQLSVRNDFALYFGSWIYDREIEQFSRLDTEGLKLLRVCHDLQRYQLVLYPLTTMTADQFREIFEAPNVTDGYAETYIDVISSSRFELFTYLAHHDKGNALQNLLANHFDVFNWIEVGLAIDATTLNPNPYEE